MQSIVIFGSTLLLLAAAQPITIGGDSKLKITISIEGEADKSCNSTGISTEHTTTTTTTARPTSNDQVFFASTSVKVNWITAQQICSKKGMTLVSINSDAKTQQLLKYLKDNQFNTTEEHAAFWTSGTRSGDGKSWVWLSTGLSFEYTNWKANEPNDTEKNEECVTMYPKGEWNDLKCDKERYFMCENRCPVNF